MPVELLTTIDELERLAPEWHQLETAESLPLPFTTAEWALSWWRHLAEDRRAVRDSMYTLAVRDPARRLLGVAPMMITGRPSAGPIRARCLQFIGADPNITELRTLAVCACEEGTVYRELASFLRRPGASWDWIRWTGIHDAGPGPEVLAAAKASWADQVPAWILPLAPTWEQFKAQLPRNMKESLRKSFNAPRRAGVDFRLEVATGVDAVQPSLDRFFELHAVRAGQCDTVVHPNVFAGDPEKAFLREACDRLASRGVVHFFNLKLGGATVATRVGFRLAESMYLYFSGYDPDYAKYSVMTRCVAEAIRWSIEAGLKTVNLSTGTDVSKTRWRPQPHLFREAVLVAPGLRASLKHALYSFVEHRFQGTLARLSRRRR